MPLMPKNMVNIYANLHYTDGTAYSNNKCQLEYLHGSNLATGSLIIYSNDWLESTTDATGYVSFNVAHSGNYTFKGYGPKTITTCSFAVTNDMTGSIDMQTLI